MQRAAGGDPLARTVPGTRYGSGVVGVNGADLTRPEVEPFVGARALPQKADPSCVGVEARPGVVLVEIVHQRGDHHATLRPVALAERLQQSAHRAALPVLLEVEWPRAR